MNQTKLLKLNKEDRDGYIRTELKKMKINELKQIVHKYGLSTKEMSKTELIEVIVAGLSNWAEKELNALYV